MTPTSTPRIVLTVLATLAFVALFAVSAPLLKMVFLLGACAAAYFAWRAGRRA